jgi:predicted AAA+ superfamily ATPase
MENKMYIERLAPLLELTKKKSFFLLGPRQTGKSFLLKHHFAKNFKINLLLNSDYLRYQKDPDLLIRELSEKKPQLIIIDEIQRVPELLNAVHFLIEETGHRFLLTGSSARKLKKSGVNLLGGRAGKMLLHPFVRA